MGNTCLNDFRTFPVISLHNILTFIISVVNVLFLGGYTNMVYSITYKFTVILIATNIGTYDIERIKHSKCIVR